MKNACQFSDQVTKLIDYQQNQDPQDVNFQVNFLKNLEESKQVKINIKQAHRNELQPVQTRSKIKAELQSSQISSLLSPQNKTRIKTLQTQQQKSLLKVIKSQQKLYLESQTKQIKAAKIKNETTQIYQNKNNLYALLLMKYYIQNKKNHKQIFDACQLLDKVCNYLSEKIKKNQNYLYVSCNNIIPVIRGNKNAFNFIVFNLLNLAIDKAVNKKVTLDFDGNEKNESISLSIKFTNTSNYSEQMLQFLSFDFKTFIKDPLEFKKYLEQYTPIVIGMSLALNQNYGILSSIIKQEDLIEIQVKFSFSVDLNQEKVSYVKHYCNDFESIQEERHEDKSMSSLNLTVSSQDEHSSAASLVSADYSPGRLIKSAELERESSFSETQKKSPLLSAIYKNTDIFSIKDKKDRRGSFSAREEEEIASWYCQ